MAQRISLKERVSAFLHPARAEMKEGALPRQLASDVAWADSRLGAMFRFAPYNPDDLIGRRGYDVYQKMMVDEQVKAVVRFIRNAITAREWYFELEDERLSDEERDFRIQLFEHIVKDMRGSFRDALNAMLRAQWQGFSMTEKVFRPVEYKGRAWIGIDRLRSKPFETFYFHTDPYGNLVRIEQKLNGAAQDLDERKFIHFVQNPDVDEYYGRSELRECYRSFYSKDVLIKLWNIFLERYAGFVTIEQTGEATMIPGDATWNDMKKIVDNLQVKSGLILPKGVKATLQTLRDNTSYKDALSYHDQAIAKSLLVPKLLGVSDQGEAGSFAQSTNQLSVFFWTTDSETARVEECLNEQLFRDLGETNFADGIYPRLKFKPLSDDKKYEMAKLWKELLTAGAVERSDDDEAWIREILGAPPKPEDEDGSGIDKKRALDAGQVGSLTELIGKVLHGDLPKATAAQLLVMAYGLRTEEADILLADIEEGSVEKPVPPGLTPQPQGDEDDPDTPPPQSGSGVPNAPGDAGDDPSNDDDDDPANMRRFVSAAAFTRAQQRVKFQVIDRRAQELVGVGKRKVATALNEVVAEMLTRAETQDMLANPEAIAGLRADGRKLRRLKAAARDVLADGWDIGRRHAQQEIDQAQGERFSVNMTRLDEEAGTFFEAKAFSMAGTLTDDVIKIIRNTMLNGIKAGSSVTDIRESVYENLVRHGFTSMGAAAEALGLDEEAMRELVEETVPLHRLETAIKTNSFEAINEARFSFFTDPGLDGFVQALEYSAILDERTTRICQHLDERQYAADSNVWDRYRPPNHFNCRSLLIPVTVRDSFDPSPEPSVKPQDGFKV